MTDLRRGPRGNPELAAALAGSTLPELVDHCTAVLARPISDERFFEIVHRLHLKVLQIDRHEEAA